MKFKVILFTLTTLLFTLQMGAQNTHYGTGAGTRCSRGTNIGTDAGHSGSKNAWLNVAVGHSALESNIDGDFNVAIGASALSRTFASSQNVAIGAYSLQNTDLGEKNVGVGYSSLGLNYDGNENTAIGYQALHRNNDGNENTALGFKALSNAGNGDYNTSIGHNSMLNFDQGSNNVALGNSSLKYLTDGNKNVAIGSSTVLFNGTHESVLLGYAANNGPSAYSNTIAIGTFAQTNASNQARIGNSNMSSIGGFASWTSISDGRFKSDVQEDVPGLDFITALRPVSYRLERSKIAKFLYKDRKDINPALFETQGEYQTGFIAQEVEATIKSLGFDHFNGVDAPKNETDHYGLRYSEFVVPLVQSVKELAAQNEQQQETIEQQAANIEKLENLIQQQQAQINQLLNNGNTSSNSTIQSSSTARMEQNTPNPFSEVANISVFLPENSSAASIMISNLEGKQLESIQINQKGESQVSIEGNKFQPGLYLYTLIVDGKIISSKKMLIVE